MSKAKTYSFKAQSPSVTSLPKDFSEKENKELLDQALRVFSANLHPGLSRVKTRGEISLSKSKVWSQKGTGRARHGSRSAPIFVGGGRAHGPKGEKRELSLPKTMRRKALKVALSMKVEKGNLFLIDKVSLVKKTKEADLFLKKILAKEKKTGRRVSVVLAKENKDALRFFRNLKKVDVLKFETLNAYQVFHGGLILLDKESLKKKASAKEGVK